jgi:hypothetical protein
MYNNNSENNNNNNGQRTTTTTTTTKRQQNNSSVLFCSNGNTEESLDTVLEHHQNMQEKIAEEMIQMAQNLKHNSLVASNILKKDNKVRLI